ncbi:MAG: DUF2341 domain-containing protein [Promethearchaeota archaeon]
MSLYRRTTKLKLKLSSVLLFLLIIPIMLNTPLFNIFHIEELNEVQNRFDERDALKLNAPPNANEFSYYKIITIDHNKVAGSSIYPDFPVLISIEDADLKTDVQPDGDDIAFSVENVWVDHEIELFDQGYNTTHAQLIAWVRIPGLSGVVDTVIRMYYGNSTITSRQNPNGVWESNYRGVWHLNEQNVLDPIIDSTANSNHGTARNSPIPGQNGQIYDSYGFTDASGQRIEVPDDTSLDISNQLTVEAWINPTVVMEWSTIVSKMDGPLDSGSTAYFDIYVAISDLGNFYIGLSNPSDSWDEWYSPVPASTGTWQHFVFTYQSSTSMGRIFLNGAYMSEHDFGIGTLGTNGNPFYIGINRGWTNEVFDGLIDEVRISSIPRSSGWINTEYVNQNDPDTFYTVGAEQIVSSDPPNAHYFTYYKIITIDHTQVAGSGSHVNFPVLISIIDSDLKYHSQPDGDDIAFSMGGDWLDHEIELYDQSYSSTQAQLATWVKIPFLSAITNTTITMFYGNSTMSSRQNPTGVWDSNYEAVWHMNQDPSSSNILDSTSNNNDLTTNGFSSDQRIYNGKVGTAIAFDGINDYLDITSFSGPTNGFTFETWFKFDSEYTIGSGDMYLFSGNTPSWGNNMPRVRFRSSTGSGVGSVATALDASDSCDGVKNVWAADTWFHYAFRFSVPIQTTTLYLNGIVDGNKVDSDLSVPHSAWNSLSIASDYGANVWGSGAISEFRVLKTALSTEWMATEFNNQYNPNSFYSVGSEQLVLEQPVNENYFNNYKVITVDQTKVNGTGSHVNFPLLISILDADLKYDVQNDGDDIAFSMDGKWLDHQIEQFNQSYSGTHARLIVWVRVPFLSTAFDTQIRMYYGNSTLNSQQNPSGVWYSDYAGVWHLDDDPSGIPLQIKDSALPASDGATYGTMTSSDQVPGMIGGALDFDGINDYVDFGNPGELQITGEITVQAWFKVIDVGNDYLIAKHGGSGFRGWDISFDDDPGIAPDGWVTFRYSPDGTNTIFTGYERVRVNQWYHAVGVFKPNEYSKFFFNGTQVGIITTGVPPSMNDPSLPLRIARRSDASTSYVDGIIDEVRVSTIARSNDWIASEYSNQYDPSSFYSVGPEQSIKVLPFVDAQINAIDLYGNLLPNVTISVYQLTQLIDRGTTDINGSILFTNLIEGSYNFTASIYSDIANITEIVNVTLEAFSLNQSFQTVDLICDVTSHFFELVDIDGSPLDSGWIMVGNDTQIFKQCNIDPTGHTTFWWVDAPPSEYNYTVYYSDALYNPSTLTLASGDITTENDTIHIQIGLTTVDFLVQTITQPITPVSGAKLILTVDDPLGASIVNLTTDINGQATLRWLNSSGIGGDYCIQIEFFGVKRLFNETIGPASVYNYSFTVNNKNSFEFRISIDLNKFQTELISLNPTDYIKVEWGAVVRLRTLFNISKVESGYESLLGPEYADIMKYELLQGGISLYSGTFEAEIGNEGRHFVTIDTKEMDSGSSYIIIISAQKSGYLIPSSLILQLDILEIEIELNQSDNDDTITSVYWADNVDMTLKSYGINSETLTIENNLFQNVDHEFSFLISDISTKWNLSKVIFNIYGISWNTNVTNINITIKDPSNLFHVYNSSNHLGWDYNRSLWTGITLDLNMASQTNDNNFEFEISGTFTGTVDIVADAYCIRDSLNAQYSKFNLSDSISILRKSEGWSIKNITFEISNCYYTSNWSNVQDILMEQVF